MKTHEEIRKQLSEYLDESLPQGEREALERHLEECPDCRGDMADLRRTVEHIRMLEKVETPSWLAGKIMARVREEAPARKRFLAWLFFPLHIKIPLEAVAVLLICFGGYFLANRTAKEGPALLPGVPPVLQTPAPPAETHEQRRERESTPEPPKTTIHPKAEKPQRKSEVVGSPALPPPAAYAPPPPPAASAPHPARPAAPSLPTEMENPGLEPLPEVPYSLKAKRAPQTKAPESPALPLPTAAQKTEAHKKAAKAVPREAVFSLRVTDPIQTVAAVEEIVEKEKGRVTQVEMEGMEVVIHVLSGPGGKDRIIAGLRALGTIEEERAAADEGRRFVIRVEK